MVVPAIRPTPAGEKKLSSFVADLKQVMQAMQTKANGWIDQAENLWEKSGLVDIPEEKNEMLKISESDYKRAIQTTIDMLKRASLANERETKDALSVCVLLAWDGK